MNHSERLRRLAGAKKPRKTIKPTKKVEKAWDAAYDFFVHKMGFGSNERAFRLLKRIKYSLELEGYKFKGDTHEQSLPSTNSTHPLIQPTMGALSHVAHSGEMCPLLRSRPPSGLTVDALVRLSNQLKSKQCYRFTMKPKDKSRTRSRGKNVTLPTPCTWHRLQKHGLSIEKIIDEDNNPIMESFRVDGILAYSLDRETFYVPNQEMGRRWLEGVDRLVDLDEKR